jgi:methionyl-tRNA synthetase
MGKDNVPFHSVMFPGSLLGTKEKWNLVNYLNSSEYLNYEGTKFSKTNQVGVFGSDIKKTKIPVEIYRIYLLLHRPMKSDHDFTWKEF